MLKFRTMIKDADKKLAELLAKTSSTAHISRSKTIRA